MEYLIICLSILSGIILLALSIGSIVYFFKHKGKAITIVGGVATILLWILIFLTTFNQVSSIFVNFQIILKILCVTLIYGFILLLLNWICIKLICKNDLDEQKTAVGIGIYQGLLLPFGIALFFLINGINIAISAFSGNISGINEEANLFITKDGTVLNVFPFSDSIFDFISIPILLIGICLCLISVAISVYSFVDKGKKLVLIPSLIIAMLMVTAVVTFIFISYNFTNEFIYKMITYCAIPLFFLIIGIGNVFFQYKIYKK